MKKFFLCFIFSIFISEIFLMILFGDSIEGINALIILILTALSLSLLLFFLLPVNKNTTKNNNSSKDDYQKPLELTSQSKIHSNNYISNDLQTYAKYLLEKSGGLFDIDDAYQFTKVLSIYPQYGKKDTIDAFDDFLDKIIKKYGLTSSTAIVSFFIGALNANGIISQSELETMLNNFVGRVANFLQRQETSKHTHIKDDPDTPMKAREYINAIKTHDDWDDPTNEFHKIIYSSIHDKNIQRKTDLLIEALNNISELFKELSDVENYQIGSANLNAVIYFRIYLDCVLIYSGDWDTVNQLYIISKMAGAQNESIHKFINTMIQISDLLDRAIVYLFKNLDTVSKDYYPIVEQKIRKLLTEYVDDNTDWNKI